MKVMKYSKYKDSDVEWLGEVPAHWDVRRLKYVLAQVTDRATERINPVALENVEGWSGRYTKSEADYSGDGVAFQKGDLLFGKLRPYLAKVYLASDYGEAVGDFHVMRPSQNMSGRFALHQLLQPQFISVVDGATHGAKMPRVGWETMGNMPYVAPPEHEQIHIATFLDHETARLDALIAEQKRLIELLKEKRQAVISHAVTKGLDPDALMKDSGVEWLGEVPAHWDVVPTGYRYEVQLGRMLNETRSSGENLKPYLRVFDVQWGDINTQDLPLMDFPPSAQKAYRLEVGDLMVNEGGSYVGRSAIWRGELSECYYQKALHRLRPRLHVSDTAGYLLYVMEMATQKGVFVANANQTTIDHLTAEQLRRHRFGFPPLVEQKEIAHYLDVSTIKLEKLTEEAQELITFLQERRSALISAAVTGKIDVRGWQAEEQTEPKDAPMAAEPRATYQ